MQLSIDFYSIISRMSEEPLCDETIPPHPPVTRSTSKSSIRWTMAAGRALNISQPAERDDRTDEGPPSDEFTRQNKTIDGSDRFTNFNKRRSSQKLLEDISNSMLLKTELKVSRSNNNVIYIIYLQRNLTNGIQNLAFNF